MCLYIIYFIYNVTFIVVVLSPSALCTHADIREFAVVHTTHVRTYNNIIIIYHIDRCDIHINIYVYKYRAAHRADDLLYENRRKPYNIIYSLDRPRRERTAVSQSPSIYYIWGVSKRTSDFKLI